MVSAGMQANHATPSSQSMYHWNQWNCLLDFMHEGLQRIDLQEICKSHQIIRTFGTF